MKQAAIDQITMNLSYLEAVGVLLNSCKVDDLPEKTLANIGGLIEELSQKTSRIACEWHDTMRGKSEIS